MKPVLILLLLASNLYASATVWNVEVGGNSSQTPYYAPQFIEIQVGDTVRWIFVSGVHNVTSISGPEPFASGNKTGNSNQSVVYSKVFTLTGTYNYQCTIADHSTTQFGSITVLDAVSIEPITTAMNTSWKVWPNPAQQAIHIQNLSYSTATLILYDYTAKLIYTGTIAPHETIDWATIGLKTGIYILEMRTLDNIYRHKVIVETDYQR